MSNVLVMPTGDETTALPERRMRLISRALSVLFTALLAAAVIWTIGAAIVSLFFAHYVRMGAEGAIITIPGPPPVTPGTVLYSDQSLVTRVAGIVDVFIATAPVFLILLHLRDLFRAYASGIVFARSNALHLRQIGVWLLAYPPAKFAAGTLYRALGGVDHAWFSSTLVFSLLLGAVVFVIAQVMAMGHEIERERAEFV